MTVGADDKGRNDPKQVDNLILGMLRAERRWKERDCLVDLRGRHDHEASTTTTTTTTTLDKDDGCNRQDLRRAETMAAFLNDCVTSTNDDDESRISHTHDGSGGRTTPQMRQHDGVAETSPVLETRCKQLSSTSPSNKASNTLKKKSGSSRHATNHGVEPQFFSGSLSTYHQLMESNHSSRTYTTSLRSVQKIINKTEE